MRVEREGNDAAPAREVGASNSVPLEHLPSGAARTPIPDPSSFGALRFLARLARRTLKKFAIRAPLGGGSAVRGNPPAPADRGRRGRVGVCVDTEGRGSCPAALRLSAHAPLSRAQAWCRSSGPNPQCLLDARVEGRKVRGPRVLRGPNRSYRAHGGSRVCTLRPRVLVEGSVSLWGP